MVPTGQSRSEDWPTLCPKQTRKGKATPLSAKHLEGASVEKSCDVAGSMEHADDFDRSGDHSIENDVAAKGKTLNPGSQLFPVAPRTGIAGQQLNGFVEFVDKGVRTRHTVIRDVAPNFD
jgi:hypothetical protein